MTSPFEFLEYIRTPKEKHHGIASVRAWGKIVLRYKLMPKKDGSGFFPGISAYKVREGTGSEDYEDAFMLEMRSENDLMIKFVLKNVMAWIQQNESGSYSLSPSVHAPQAQKASMPYPSAPVDAAFSTPWDSVPSASPDFFV